MTQRAAFCLIFLMGLPHFWGCSGKPVDENNPQSLYEDAEADVKSDRYQMAIEKLRTVKNKFPYSSYSAKAQLKIADVYFMQEAFIEAAASYEGFRDLYPKHEEAPYASFRAGESYAKDVPTNVARDLSSAIKAQESIKEYIARYPTHGRVEDAKKLLAEVRNQLAHKEFYIAEFYFKQKKFSSAKGRYLRVVETYPDSKFVEDSQKKIAIATSEIEKEVAGEPKK